MKGRFDKQVLAAASFATFVAFALAPPAVANPVDQLECSGRFTYPPGENLSDQYQGVFVVTIGTQGWKEVGQGTSMDDLFCKYWHKFHFGGGDPP